MWSKHSSRVSVALASLFLLWAGSLGAIAQAQPTVTILGLRVRGADVACGATVNSGDQVCVLFQSDQSGTAAVTVTNQGTGNTTNVISGSVTAGLTYIACTTADTPDGQVRTLTVTVTNDNGPGSGTCNFTVAAAVTMPPNVTILGLRVNGVTTTCGATVNSGDQVCVLFQVDQNAFVTVSVTKTGFNPGTVAAGSVRPGVTYIACVTAGAADGLLRTFTVQASNNNGSNSAPCTYTVAAVLTQAPKVTIVGLQVNGFNTFCGAHVNPGDQVCVLFRVDQNAFATVSIMKTGFSPRTLAAGSVRPGVTYITCVTAGAADGLLRTFTVQASNNNGSNSAPCSYIVP